MANNTNDSLTFDANSAEHKRIRTLAKFLIDALNTLPADATAEERAQIWHTLIGLESQAERAKLEYPTIHPPFRVDYGTKLNIAPSAVIGKGCVFVDSPVRTITIGARTVLGQDVHILSIPERPSTCEHVRGPATVLASDVFIGEDCVIGAGSTIMPGVRIGDHNTIPMGTTIRESIPATEPHSSDRTGGGGETWTDIDMSSHVRRRPNRASGIVEASNNPNANSDTTNVIQTANRKLWKPQNLDKTSKFAFSVVAWVIVVEVLLRTYAPWYPPPGNWWDPRGPNGVSIYMIMVMLVICFASLVQDRVVDIRAIFE